MVAASATYGCSLYLLLRHLRLQVLAVPLSLQSGEAVAVLQLFEKRGAHIYMTYDIHMHMHMHMNMRSADMHAHMHMHMHMHTRTHAHMHT